MTGNVIPFPSSPPEYKSGGIVSSGKPVVLEEDEEIVRQTPIQLFQFADDGTVDLAEGIAVTDAVTALWETLQGVVVEAWSEHPLSRERARVSVLTAFLDSEHPGWRKEMAWAGF